jgi:methyl-accepting chemotaxis protein
MNPEKMNAQKTAAGKTMRTQLMLIILVLSFVICLLVGGLSCLQLYNTAIDGAETGTSVCAEGYSDAIKNAIETFMSDVETAAYDSRITDPQKTIEEKEAILASLASKLGFISIGVADAEANTYNGANISDREYFQSAIAGKTYISSPVIRKTDSSIVLFVAAKIDNDTDYNGVVYAALSNDTFSKIIANATIGDKGYAFVLDKTGTIIAHKDAALVSEFISFTQLAEEDAQYADIAALSQKMTALETGVENVTVSGENKLIAYQPIEGTDGWSMAIVADRGEMLTSFSTNLKVVIGLCVLVLIIGAVISLLVSKSIAGPISNLTHRVELLACGDLKTPVPKTHRKDEIFKLSDALSQTIRALNSFIEDIDNVLMNIANKNIAVETSVEYIGDFAPIKASLDTITRQLNAVMQNIKDSASLVFVNAQQVSEGSQTVAGGSTEQASAVEELSATLESIAGDIKDMTGNASEAKMITQTASAAVEDGNRRMLEMSLHNEPDLQRLQPDQQHHPHD